MKRLNKKGLEIADPMFVLITIIALTIVYMNVGSSLPETKIGEKQTDIFTIVQVTQNEMFFLDLGAKYAGLDSIYSLASKGGFYKENLCGEYYGKTLWSYKNKEEEYAFCMPEIERELEKEFKEDYETFLAKNGEGVDYKYFVQENNGLEIRGISLVNKEKEIEPERKYSYKPTTTQKYDYKLKAYDKINEFIERLNENCNEKEDIKGGTELTLCVDDVLTAFEDELEGFIELKIIQPTDENVDLNFKQVLKEIERTGYEECYFNFPKLGNNFPLTYEIENFGAEKMYSEIGLFYNKNKIRTFEIDLLFYIIKPNQEQSLITYPDKTIKYDVAATELIYDFEGSERIEPAELDFFKKDRNKAGFIPKKEKIDFSTYLRNRPCSYENRMFMFELKEKELYLEKGEIVYSFGVYVEDKKEPFIPAVKIESKEFDEGTLLIKWKHTSSLDLMNYTIFVDGNLVKKVVPWKEVNIYDSINWEYGDKKPFNTCKMDDEGEFKKCVYSFGNTFKDSNTYYFQESNEWVYVLNGLEDEKTYDIVIKASDNDGNTFSSEQKPGISVDTLPFAPVEFQLINDPLRTHPQTQIYKGIVGTPLMTVFNMDGTISAGGFEFEFVHSLTPIITFKEENLDNYYLFGASVPGYSLAVPTYYLIVQKDPALDNIVLYVNEMGYQPKTIP